MINQLKIEPLQPTQLKATLELDRLCLGGLWSLETYQREIDSPNSTLLVLSLGEPQPGVQEQIIGLGCIWAILEEAHLTILAIHPQYHRQGLGELLLLNLLEDAIARKLERATLEVKVSNQAAINLYQKFGFQTAGRRKNYYPDSGEDALILWRSGLDKRQFQQQLHRLKIKLQQNNWHCQ